MMDTRYETFYSLSLLPDSVPFDIGKVEAAAAAAASAFHLPLSRTWPSFRLLLWVLN